MLEMYTRWIRECLGADELSINPSSDKGPYPYQWKVASADGLFLGYVIFHGPMTNGSENERRAELCRLLNDVKAQQSMA
jgi:hypothetical protein